MGDDERYPRFSGARARSYSARHLRQHQSRDVFEASFTMMNGWERRSIKMEAGDEVQFRVETRAESGSLCIELQAPDGTTIVRWGDQPFVTTDYQADLPGKYGLRVNTEQAAGSYRVELGPTAPAGG